MAQENQGTTEAQETTRFAQRRRAFLRGLAAAPERFPLPVAGIVALAVLSNLEIQIKDLALSTRLIFSLFGAIAAALAATLQGERANRSWPVRHGVAAVAMAIVGTGLWFGDSLGPVFPFAVLIAILVTIPLAPYADSRRGAGFWAFQWRLAAAGLIGLLASLLVMGGLTSILATLKYLFSVWIPSQVSEHIIVTSLTLIGPLFFLGFVSRPVPLNDPTVDMKPVPGLQVMTDFVAVPLIVLYALVLHVYAVKIAITGDIPENEIGKLVVLFSLSVLSLRVILPPGAVFSGLPGRFFTAFWPALLVVPLGLLILAVTLRIQAYGVTPSRYGLGMFAGILALLILAHLVPRLRGDIRPISALTAIAILVASAGPWGVEAVTVESQFSRLERLLTEAEILQDDRVVVSSPLPRSDREAVRSILLVLRDHDALDRVRPWLADHPNDPFATANTNQSPSSTLVDRVEAALASTLLPPTAAPTAPITPVYTFVLDPIERTVPIENYDVFVANLSWRSWPTQVIASGPLRLVATPASDHLGLALQDDETPILFPIDPLRSILQSAEPDAFDPEPASVPSGEGDREITLFQPTLLELTSSDGNQVGLIIDNLTVRVRAGRMTITAGEFDLLMRREDWVPSGE